MNVGTKSLLFGVHQFAIHPWFVAYAWWKLFGFPWDPRLWVAFFIHDIGYWGKPNMDGIEGESHPFVGARWMALMFGPKWFDFVLYHSRFMAKGHNRPVSKLCYADKLSIVVTPRWLYFFLGGLSGELKEYLERARTGKYVSMNISTADKQVWHADMCRYLKAWIAEHKDGKQDDWTPS